MILTGQEIRRQVEDGKIEITPFYLKQINPASYDLRLGDKYLTYAPRYAVVPSRWLLDSKSENLVEEHLIYPDGVTLEPGTLYLMHTTEIIHTNQFVSVIDGKSSLARLGIVTHLTAGYGDPGFRGQYTLEVSVVHPVRVYAGMRFCQIRFHTVQGERIQYRGNYTGEAAMGPVASRSWKQFKEKADE